MTKVCSSKKNDGFGSVYYSCMSTIAYCRKNNYIYRHTHFDDLPGFSLHHNYEKKKDFTSLLNDFTGLKSDSSDNLLIEVDYGIIGNSVLGAFPCKTYCFTSSVISELRKMYYSTWKPEIIKGDVIVHIRRGDIARNPKIKNGKPVYGSNRYIKLDYFKRKIIEIQNKNEKKLKFIIFSQGNKNNFNDLLIPDYDIELQLNIELKQTFHSMVEAPILVLSPSMLSITAAILNIGEIHYYEWGVFSPPLKHWYKDKL